MWGKCGENDYFYSEMATVKFITKTSKKDLLATVYVRYRSGRTIDETVPTEFKVYPELWNNKTQKFKQRIVYTDTFPEKDKVNLELKFRNLKDFILKKVNEGGKVDLTSWVDEFHHPLGGTNLNQFIEQFVEECKSGARLTEKKTRYTGASVKSLRAFKTQLDLFQEQKHKYLNFGDITLDFYDDFVSFFVDKGYSPNTIGKYIKHLKTVMRSARDAGMHTNVETERRKFKSPSAEVTNIYLTEKEIKAMYELDLSSNPLYDLARDVFLVGCYTAQRFSDYSRIKAQNIRIIESNVRVIELIQQKTKQKVIIPIRPELDRILKKYNYNLPKVYEQKVNKNIKEVGRLAGIKEMINTETIKGGLTVKAETPKHQLIKTHTARRSGCTNMYLAGISPIDIMKISGHKTEKEFKKYINVTREQTAISLASHPYFKGTNLKVVK